MAVLSRTQLSFVVMGTPVGQAALSHGRGGHAYYSNAKKLKPWRAAVAAAAREHIDEYGLLDYPLPKEAAVHLEVTFWIPRPKTVRRTYPTVYPDLQHYVRAAEDSLTKIVWADDGQVVDTVASKRYARDGLPCAIINVRTLDFA